MKISKIERNPLILAQALDRTMARIPAGSFAYGMAPAQREIAARKENLHPDLVHFHTRAARRETKEFWIDRHPVTRGQFLRFLRETGYAIPYNGWRVGWTELVDVERLDNPARRWCPIVGVNCEDAQAYARWAGKRLPTEVEWEKAARGKDGRLFPWGPDFQPVTPLAGNLTLDSAMPVGARPHLASPYGVQDLKGGVLEWVQTVEPPCSPNGLVRDPSPFILAGSSILHRRPSSHLVTARWSWHHTMRVYDTGFRCVSDTPPPAPPVTYTPSPDGFVRVVRLQREACGREPIQLEPMEFAGFKIRVPWLPESLWVVDIPENSWGPFPGADHWPDHPRRAWAINWKTNAGGTRLDYRRQRQGQALRVAITAEGDLVRCRVEPKNIGAIDLDSICVKTFSPFFSSQERLTQHRIAGRRLVGVWERPLRPDFPCSLGWTAGANLPRGEVVMRAYDGPAFLSIAGREGCDSWGNGWPHCTHLHGPGMATDGPAEIRLRFFVGSEAELLGISRPTAGRAP